ncbi:MAG: purine-nucleoside phosphorylase [Ignavibacteriaceae bacterium]|nr:purine-nucleoside phosphorylase [Ignavibacteriaceae bacterium]
MPTAQLSFKYDKLLGAVKDIIADTPDIAVILGSGLGDFPSELSIEKVINTADLPQYPPSTVAGHGGKIFYGKIDTRNVLVFQGRLHFYEGYSLSECLLPVIITDSLNIRKLIVTNAAGGVNPSFSPGDLMLAVSFNALMIKNELQSIIPVANPKQYEDLQRFGTSEIAEIIRRAAEKTGFKLVEGVYWFNKGPMYETPAEVKMAGVSGADAVGMSSVHETLYAITRGIDTAMISLISNMAAGISKSPLSHQEVMETANLVKVKFNRLIREAILLTG